MTVLSLATILAEGARSRPGKVAIVDRDQRITYAELWRQARGYGAALRQFGVKAGDAVAILCPNVAEFPRAYYGALAAGATVVPVHLLLAAEEATYVLKDSGATVLLCYAGDASQLAVGVAAAAATGVALLTIGPPVDGYASLDEAADKVEPLPTYLTREAEDPAVIFYTSGTTGTPKGAVLTHLNLVMNATVNVFDANETTPDDIALGCLPLFHTFGQSVSMNGTFRRGGTLVLLARFTGEAAIELMRQEHVDVFHGVPTMYVALNEAAGRFETLPRLRLCVSGGASLPVAVLERFQELFSTQIFEGYGLSETSPTATTNQPRFGTRPGTIGHPIWGVEVEIADATVEDRIEFVASGTLGEIVIRGHNVFAGYLGNPEATAQAVVDGWFRSGDLGTKDADGFITVVDRKKDLIIRGGFNVYPREVEEVLARHPAIMQVAVVGRPDEVHGEEICAVVVPAGSSSAISADELREWAKARLGRHKYPREYRIVDELPLGPSGKVLKRELRRRLS
jgi:long-chain acyl-CoA synthetase